MVEHPEITESSSQINNYEFSINTPQKTVVEVEYETRIPQGSKIIRLYINCRNRWPDIPFPCTIANSPIVDRLNFSGLKCNLEKTREYYKNLPDSVKDSINSKLDEEARGLLKVLLEFDTSKIDSRFNDHILDLT